MKNFILCVALALLSANSALAHPKDTSDWLYVLGSDNMGHTNSNGKYRLLYEGSKYNEQKISFRLIKTPEPDRYAIHVDDDKINEETFNTLRDMLGEIKKSRGIFIEVYLNSPGGYSHWGIKIGELFREHKVFTKVIKGQNCLSACADMFIGGVDRSIKGGRVGVHAAYLEGKFNIITCFEDEESSYRAYVNRMLVGATLKGYVWNKGGIANLYYDKTMNTCGKYDLYSFYEKSLLETTETNPATVVKPKVKPKVKPQAGFWAGKIYYEGGVKYKVLSVPKFNDVLVVNVNKAWVFNGDSNGGSLVTKLEKGVSVSVWANQIYNNRVYIRYTQSNGKVITGWMHVTTLDRVYSDGSRGGLVKKL